MLLIPQFDWARTELASLLTFLFPFWFGQRPSLEIEVACWSFLCDVRRATAGSTGYGALL